MNLSTKRKGSWTALSISVLMLAMPVNSQEVLTNASVLTMTKAHLSDKLIIAKIQSSRAKYDVTADALAALKNQKVSEDVIAAMMAKMSEPANTQSSRAANSPPPEAITPERFQYREEKDEITGETRFYAWLRRLALGDKQFRFEVKATCSLDELSLVIAAYHADSNAGVSYKLTDLRPRPKVVARTAIDGRVTNMVSSVPEYPNAATFLFNPRPADEAKEILSTLVKGSSGLSVTDISADEVYSAKLMKIELPIDDGDHAILEIYPQDDDFQKFASTCKAADERERRQRDPFGPPSISDSLWNLDQKARQADNAKVKRSLARINQAGKVDYVFGVPGTTCSYVYVPGDILPGLLDWNAQKTQTVYARCRAKTWSRQITVGQLEIDPMGLAELKKRRSELIAAGVSETAAPAEPDAPAQTLPPSWTTRSSWYICSPTDLYHTDKTKNKKGATPVQIPTEASIVSHAWGVFQVRLANDPTELYDAFWNNLSQSCGTQAVINSPPSTTTDTTLQGFLTIRVDPPGSVIEIAGLGRVAATTGEIPLRVGQYSISVKHDGMPPQERTIAVSAGEHALAEFHLSADPEYPIRHIALTQKLLADGNAVDAIQEANRVLAVVPTNVEARSLLAMASFRANDARGFVSASQQALAGGGGVTITLLHVHTGKRRALHPVNLRISSATMSYDPQGTLCDIPPFEIALNQIGAAEMRKYDNGDVLLVLTGGRLGASKTEQIEFAALGSQWSIPDNQIIPKGVAPLTSPQIAIKMLEAVDLVFRNVLPSMH